MPETEEEDDDEEEEALKPNREADAEPTAEPPDTPAEPTAEPIDPLTTKEAGAEERAEESWREREAAEIEAAAETGTDPKSKLVSDPERRDAPENCD